MPHLSVIIPVRDDPVGLADTLDSLAGQSHVPFEVVVVDNGSRDSPMGVVAEAKGRMPAPIRLVHEPRPGSYAARNAGVRTAAGDVLCFFDADERLGPEALARVARRFRDPGTSYLGCRIELHAERPTLSALADQVRGIRNGTYLEQWHFAATAGACVRRSVLERVGAFDARLESGGDKELGQRVHAAGIGQVYAPEVVVRHPARTRYGELAAKERRLARGVAQLERFFPARYPPERSAYRKLRTYLPRHPARLRRRLAELGLRPGTWRSACVAVWVVPLRVLGGVEYLRERRRLATREGEDEPRPADLAARPPAAREAPRRAPR